ncbi:unnamed protein product [Gongylonema pulchrum]|nr:unnamed protein product [Gongylonema pulchrum]
MLLVERVDEAQKLAKQELKEMDEKKGKKRKRLAEDDELDDTEESNYRKKFKRKQKGGRGPAMKSGRRKF